MLGQIRERLLPSELSEFKRLNEINFASGLGDSAWLLYGLVRSMKPAVCVEIGSAQGRSTCFIGKALKDNGAGVIYAIDPHSTTQWNDANSVDTYEVIRRNLARVGLNEFVRIQRSTSREAVAGWSHPIDILFIDGDHSYEGVKADWDLFTPHVSQFGVVIFHDTLWEYQRDSKWYRPDVGVPRFVEELRLEGYPVITLNRDYGVSLVQATRRGVDLSNGEPLASHNAPVGK
jgi:predicted O-methyltransferase YrrM